jgi:hypothetical protein
MGSGLDESIYWTDTSRNVQINIPLRKIPGAIKHEIKYSTLPLMVAPGTISVF